MRLSLSFTAWLLSGAPATAFLFPQVRATIERRLFAKDPEISNLLNEYSKATRDPSGRRAPVVEATPSIDVTPPVMNDPPVIEIPPPPVVDVPTPEVNVPTTFPELKVPESVLSKKVSLAELFSKAHPPSEKAPSLVEWITHRGNYMKETLRAGDPSLFAPPTEVSNFDRVVNLKEKLEIIKQNALDLTAGIKDISPGVTVDAFDSEKVNAFSGKIIAGVAAASTAATNAVSSKFNFKDFLDIFHFDQFGAWYVVILTFVWGFAQRKAGRDEVEKSFVEQLSKVQEKANEAAEFATIAEQSARTTKRRVYKADNDPNKAVLEATRVKVLQMDMVSDIKGKSGLISNASLTPNILQDEVKREAEKLRTEAQMLKDSLKQAEAKAAIAVELEAKLSAAQAQLAAVTEALPAPKTADIPGAPASETSSSEASPKIASSPVPATEPVATFSKPGDKVESFDPSTLKTKPVPAPEPVADDPTANINISDSFEAIAASSPKPTKGEKPPTTSDATKSVKKAKKVKKASVTPIDVAPLPNASTNPVVEPPFELVNDDNAWTSLSDASLKRKTVKELSDFLIARVRQNFRSTGLQVHHFSLLLCV